MTKSEIIEKLKPRCDGHDLPLSLNIDLVAEILTEPCAGENDVLHVVSGTLPIGAKVVIIDDDNAFGSNANREMTVTGYGEWRGNPQGGYILNDMTDSLWLAEDFESVVANG